MSAMSRERAVGRSARAGLPSTPALTGGGRCATAAYSSSTLQASLRRRLDERSGVSQLSPALGFDAKPQHC